MRYTASVVWKKSNTETDGIKKIGIMKPALKKINSAFFPLFIILGGYIVPGTNNTPLGTVLVFLSALVFFCLKRNKSLYLNKLNNKLILFFILYIAAQQVIVLAVFPTIPFGAHIKNLLMNVLAIFAILILPEAMDEEGLERSYLVFGLIACLGLLLQTFQVYVLHGLTRMIVLPGLGSFLSEGTRNYIDYSYNRGRPSAFFTEPSAFATFLAPLVIMMLRKGKLFVAAIASICMLLSTSTIGIFLVGAIWAYWVMFTVPKKGQRVIAIFLFWAACIWIFNSPLFAKAITKLLNTNLLSNERSASALTILRQMPFMDILTGIGGTNVSNYIYSIRQMNMSDVAVTSQGYVTSGFGNFIIYGLLGGLLYIYLCIKMAIKADKWSRLIALLILVLSFVQTITFNLSGIQWFVFYALMRKSEAARISDKDGENR